MEEGGKNHTKHGMKKILYKVHSLITGRFSSYLHTFSRRKYQIISRNDLEVTKHISNCGFMKLIGCVDVFDKYIFYPEH